LLEISSVTVYLHVTLKYAQMFHVITVFFYNWAVCSIWWATFFITCNRDLSKVLGL